MTEEALQLISYSPEYKDGFARLVKNTLNEFSFTVDESLDKDLENPEAYYENIWILVNQSNVVGTVALERKSDSEATLKRMYLDPELRGQGFGRLMLSVAIETSKKAGYEWLTLDTTRSQVQAQKAYKAAGFILVHSTDEILYFKLPLK